MPSAPADIKAVTSGESSAIVSWRAPALSNGLIQKYTVYRREIISGKEAIHFPLDYALDNIGLLDLQFLNILVIKSSHRWRLCRIELENSSFLGFC